MRQTRLVVAVVAVTVLLSACGDDGGTGGGDGGSGGAATVDAALSDFSIVLSANSVAKGSVTFNATNEGPSVHELVILKTDLAPDALPVDAAKVDEAGPGVELIGEIEEFASGATEPGTFDLSAGSYVLVCNIPGHYPAGMTVGFTVT